MHAGESGPTHAGGVVYRIKDGHAQYLLIRPKSGADEWLLPKGHIDKGESEEEAALREVTEETGVTAQTVCPIAQVELTIQQMPVRVRFFLMKRVSEGSAHEQREHQWFPYNEALRVATHSQSRHLLEEGEKTRRERQS